MKMNGKVKTLVLGLGLGLGVSGAVMAKTIAPNCNYCYSYAEKCMANGVNWEDCFDGTRLAYCETSCPANY